MAYLTEITELVTAILIGVLFSIFMSAFFLLIIVLQRKTRPSYSSKNNGEGLMDSFKTIPEVMLLKPVSSDMMNNTSEISLNDEQLFDDYDFFSKNVDDPNWIQDTSTLISHCMAVLVNCRMLTEKLTGIAMNMLDEWDPHMGCLVEIAKLITLRVDQLVTCMRPPLNPQVLEARAASLTLAVTHLAIMTQYDGRLNKVPADWISKLLNNIQAHIDMLNCETQNFFHNKDSFQILHKTSMKNQKY